MDEAKVYIDLEIANARGKNLSVVFRGSVKLANIGFPKEVKIDPSNHFPFLLFRFFSFFILFLFLFFLFLFLFLYFFFNRINSLSPPHFKAVSHLLEVGTMLLSSEGPTGSNTLLVLDEAGKIQRALKQAEGSTGMNNSTH